MGDTRPAHRHPATLPREFLAEIVDCIAHPIFVKDRAFRFVLLNRAFAEMAGYPRERMLGKTDFDFFPESEARFFRQKDVEMFGGGQTVKIDAEPITDAAGQRHILSTTKVPLRDEHGEITHLVGIIHDITHLKDVEDRLRIANEELESRIETRTQELARTQELLLTQERMAVLGQLAGGLAHQIRNPLGAISNVAFVLRRRLHGAQSPDVERAIEILLEEIQRANRIVTDLVEYARLRSPRLQRVGISELLADLELSRLLPPGVRLVERVGAVPCVEADPVQVLEALGNIVRNAVEAMSGHGQLTIEARREGEFVVLALTDTGPGVLESMEHRLFEPLVTTKADGFGLGLTTARNLIENQGGSLAYQRADPPGARFEVRLPIMRPA